MPRERAELRLGSPVMIVRNGHVVARGFFYGQTSPEQVAVRCAAGPSWIGLFNAADVVSGD